MGDVVGGIAGGVVSLIGGNMTAHASKNAANAEVGAINQGLSYQQGIYDTTKQNLNPYINTGSAALGALSNFYGLGGTPGAQAGFNQFQQTPFYQFPLQQGTLALNRQLAASGLIGSGAALKEGAQYASGLASQGLGTYLSGLSNLSGAGLNASTTLGSQGLTTAGNALKAYTDIGQANAGGIMGANNALQQGYQGAVGAFSSILGGGSSYGGGGGGGGIGSLAGLALL